MSKLVFIAILLQLSNSYIMPLLLPIQSPTIKTPLIRKNYPKIMNDNENQLQPITKILLQNQLNNQDHQFIDKQVNDLMGNTDPQLIGGFSEFKPIDDKVQKLFDGVVTQLKTSLKGEIGTIKALDYKSQVVAGINYEIRFKTDSGMYSVKIYEPLPFMGSTPSVLGVSKLEQDMDA